MSELNYLPARLTFRGACVAAVVGGALLLGGCAGSTKKPKDLAQARWNSARAGVMMTLANDQFKNGQLDECEKSLMQARAMVPDNAALSLLHGKLYLEKGNLEQAEVQLKKAQTLDAKNAEAPYLLGVVYQRWQKTTEALMSYSLATELSPGEVAYVLARAEALVGMEQNEQAIAYLKEQTPRFENSPAVRDMLGQLLMTHGQPQQAIDAFRQAILLAGGDDTIREHLAFALLKAQKYSEAVDTFVRLTANEPNASRLDLLTGLGESYVGAERYRDAKAVFEKVTTKDPESSPAWLNLAKASMEVGDLPRGELAVRRALALAPTSPQANLMLGYFRLQQEKLPEALAAFRRAAKLDPKDAVSVTMTGLTLEKMGRKDEAVQEYRRAKTIDPADPLAADLLAGMGD